jgi:hypothetical protein
MSEPSTSKPTERAVSFFKEETFSSRFFCGSLQTFGISKKRIRQVETCDDLSCRMVTRVGNDPELN